MEGGPRGERSPWVRVPEWGMEGKEVGVPFEAPVSFSALEITAAYSQGAETAHRDGAQKNRYSPLPLPPWTPQPPTPALPWPALPGASSVSRSLL